MKQNETIKFTGIILAVIFSLTLLVMVVITIIVTVLAELIEKYK